MLLNHFDRDSHKGNDKSFPREVKIHWFYLKHHPDDVDPQGRI